MDELDGKYWSQTATITAKIFQFSESRLSAAILTII